MIAVSFKGNLKYTVCAAMAQRVGLLCCREVHVWIWIDGMYTN